jgi:hypothetical protein
MSFVGALAHVAVGYIYVAIPLDPSVRYFRTLDDVSVCYFHTLDVVCTFTGDGFINLKSGSEYWWGQG